ncbi:hypothetical protein MKW98_006606 [Papaver atlanticum]|uniref:Exostosin GT47 domain-containing protein n=1 Tax=Papaver atlanticum TaxID=357466 RepID=A0AAD4T9I7_9MAGN|nr:hypothetical protein MKW98_006606 [Papaver atlanticum]
MLPKTDPPLLKSKSFSDHSSSYYYSSIQTFLSTHPRSWILLCILSLQIFLLFCIYSLPVSFSFHHFPPPPLVNTSTIITTPQTTTTTAAIIKEEDETPIPAPTDGKCSDGRVYVYELPRMFNRELSEKCDELNPWNSRCEAISNNGLGRKYTSNDGRIIGKVIPDKLKSSWYFTDQFASEIIYHNRILRHKCRTFDPTSASAYYLPFYAGLAVGKYLWSDNYTSVHRDYHSVKLLKWAQKQVYFKRSKGWDHFIMLGRISWDFRRSKDNDWGSSFIYMPAMHNITRLLIERNPWDYFDIGVPYPTGFHPKNESELTQWQGFVRSRVRKTLFSFAGARRGTIKNDFRGLLLDQCKDSGNRCKLVDCGGNRCVNGSSAILETFLESDFCLQPRGDSFTRRSIFDCMIAGSIPVFFWHRSAYYQYEWFLPSEPESYSVYIDRKDVINGTSIRGVLEKFSKNEVRKMRDKVIEYIPKFVYADSRDGLGSSTQDAFDVAIDGVLKRFKAHRNMWDTKEENTTIRRKLLK